MIEVLEELRRYYDKGTTEYTTIQQAITDRKALQSADMVLPKQEEILSMLFKHSANPLMHKRIVKPIYNFFKPIVAKLQAEIAELEEESLKQYNEIKWLKLEIEELKKRERELELIIEKGIADNEIKILKGFLAENSKLKEKIEEFRRISKIGLEYELANYKRLRRAYEDSENNSKQVKSATLALV